MSTRKNQLKRARVCGMLLLGTMLSACGGPVATAPSDTASGASSPSAAVSARPSSAASASSRPAASQASAASPSAAAVPSTPAQASAASQPAGSATPVVELGSSLARGYLTTPAEVARVASLARQGQAPYKQAVATLLEYAEAELDGKELRAPQKMNIGGDIEKPEFLAQGSKQVYAWAIAYNLLKDSAPAQAEEYAERAYDLLMDMPRRETRVNDYENNTRLNISVYIGNFVYAADLLADWPTPNEGVPFAASADAQLLKEWLGKEMIRYPYNAAHTRVNNWGAWGRLATAVVADYVGDAAPLYVQELELDDRGSYQVVAAVACEPGETASCEQVSAGTMYRDAIQLHLAAVDGRLPEFSEASCDSIGSQSMIRPDGGLPDELRREYTCDATTIPDPYGPAARYSQFAAEAMVSLAELAWRRGDPSIYTHVDPETGRGALYRAIQFLVDNDVTLTRGSMLEMANRFYSYQERIEPDAAKRQEYARLLGTDLPGILKAENDWPVGEGFVSFGTLTHGFSAADQALPPPSVAPRSAS